VNRNVSPQQFHPNLNQYRDGGMGGVGEDHSVVGYVPTHALSGMPGNGTYRDRVDHYADRLRNGQGFDDPIMVDFDPTSKMAMVGEGNHRLQAAVEQGLSHVPVRVSRSRVPATPDESRGRYPRHLDPGPSPWKNGGGEDYWPSDIHPKYLWPSEDVK
jgi:hypothetical protein